VPLAVHCAEFSEEHELLATQSGPFRSWLESLGAWDPDALVPSHEQLLHWLAPAPQLLLVHLNYPNPAVLEILRDWAAQRKVAVVYCPRTHAYFGHSPHPWLSLLDRGVPVILGTDSRASNPDLNVLAELRWLWRRGCPLSPAQLLRLATHTAAQLLGWPQAGSLVPGSFADFLVFSLAEVEHGDPLRTLLEVNTAPQHVYIAGEVIHSAS
jgi:cytosine/adenosine deaminase-related metal-dependent hydrolase